MDYCCHVSLLLYFFAFFLVVAAMCIIMLFLVVAAMWIIMFFLIVAAMCIIFFLDVFLRFPCSFCFAGNVWQRRFLVTTIYCNSFTVLASNSHFWQCLFLVTTAYYNSFYATGRRDVHIMVSGRLWPEHDIGLKRILIHCTIPKKNDKTNLMLTRHAHYAWPSLFEKGF